MIPNYIKTAKQPVYHIVLKLDDNADYGFCLCGIKLNLEKCHFKIDWRFVENVCYNCLEIWDKNTNSTEKKK